MPAKPEVAFEFEDELWTRATRFVNGVAWQSALHIKHAPPDPSAN